MNRIMTLVMTIVIFVSLILCAFMLFGCSGLGAEKKTTAMPDELKVKPEWNEDKEGDFHFNRVGAEFVWKLK